MTAALNIEDRAALSLLRRAADKSANDGEELRSTKQVAEYVGVETKDARKILEKLYDRDLVNGFKDSANLVWSITDLGRRSLSQNRRTGE